MPSPEVDSFGRVIPSHHHGQQHHGERDRNRSPRPEYRDRGYRRYERRQNSRERNYRDSREGQGYRSRSPVRRPPSPPPPPPQARTRVPPLKPLLSYKNFILHQADDVSPEQYQVRYNEYQLQYCQDVSNHFFESAKLDEWFHDRYNPVTQQEKHAEMGAWAQQEAQRFTEKFLQLPAASVAACRLSIQSSETPREQQSGGDADASSQDPSANAVGPALDGHDNRTIYLTSLPATCPQSVLIASITAALATSEMPKPIDRVVFSTPQWNNRTTNNIPVFDRCGWVILHPDVRVGDALSQLRTLKVIVPGPPDVNGEATVAFTFPLQATLHTPRPQPQLPVCMSYPKRIFYDTQRALLLVGLLDVERGVAPEYQLETLLKHPEILPLCIYNSDILDITLAYLRRVHFTVYYGGKRFRDEGHMLHSLPSVLYRSGTSRLMNEPRVEKSSEVTPGEDGEEDDADHDESAEAPVEVTEETTEIRQTEDTETQTEVVAEAEPVDISSETETQQLKHPMIAIKRHHYIKMVYDGRIPTQILLVDRRISDLIHQVHGRNYHRQKKQNDPNYPSTKDEEDAKRIIDAQDKVMDDVADEFCLSEADGKARCSISYCKKLFKNKEFLKKHIKSKHPEVALEKMVRVAEPYMRERYEKEHILQRNLPSIAIESKDGVELKPFKEIFEPAHSSLMIGSSFHSAPAFIPPPPPFRRPSFDRQSFERRDRPQRERRAPPAPPQAPPSSMMDESGHKRPLVSYADVDAPQASAVELNYGVTVLPPAKKKKLVIAE